MLLISPKIHTDSSLPLTWLLFVVEQLPEQGVAFGGAIQNERVGSVETLRVLVAAATVGPGLLQPDLLAEHFVRFLELLLPIVSLVAVANEPVHSDLTGEQVDNFLFWMLIISLVPPTSLSGPLVFDGWFFLWLC